MSAGEGSGIPASCYLAPPRPRAGTEPLARLPSSFEGGGYCSSGVPSPSGQDGSSSGDLSPAAALCSLAKAVIEQRKLSGALPMTPEAQAVKKAIIASTTAAAGDWHPLIPLNFTLPPHYLPVSPSKMPLSQKRAAIKAAEAAAAAKGEKLDSAALAAIPMFSSHEPTLKLTRVYCGIQKRVYFEVYPHVYELYKLKSSQDRNAMLKEMMELVGPPERVVLPLPNLAATGRKPHPCLLITAEGLRQVALKMKNSSPDIVAVLNNLYAISSREDIADLLNQAEVLHPDQVVMGQTWQRAWSGDEAPQISGGCDTLPSPTGQTPSYSNLTSPMGEGPPGVVPTDKASPATQMQQSLAQNTAASQTGTRKKPKKKGGKQGKSTSSVSEDNEYGYDVASGEDGDTEDNVEHTIGRVPFATTEIATVRGSDQQQPQLFVPLQRRRIDEPPMNGFLMPPMQNPVLAAPANLAQTFQPMNELNLISQQQLQQQKQAQSFQYPGVQGQQWRQ